MKKNLVKEREALEKAYAPTKEFEVYAVGLSVASACSSLSRKDTLERMSRIPTGISSPWQFSKDTHFHTGEENPHPCERHPKTHKHYLFEC